MKATNHEKIQKAYPFGKPIENLFFKEHENALDFQQFTVPTPMTDQEIAPPTHVWNKIVSILDEQDRQKEMLFEQVAAAARPKPRMHRRFVFASMTATLVAAIVWFLF